MLRVVQSVCLGITEKAFETITTDMTLEIQLVEDKAVHNLQC